MSTRVSKRMAKEVDNIINNDGHVNRADYLRDLIRQDLEKRTLMK
jgi:metal-responsive CopG/Arc/MetJ family transcriptional regulator